MRNNGNGFALCFHLVEIDFKLKVTDFHLEHLSKVWNRKSKRKEIVMLVSDNMSLSSTRTLLIGNRSGNSRRSTKQNATINSPVHISRFFEIHDEISPGIVDPVHRFTPFLVCLFSFDFPLLVASSSILVCTLSILS